MFLTSALLVGGAVYLSTKAHNFFHKKENLATMLAPNQKQVVVNQTDHLTDRLPAPLKNMLAAGTLTAEEQEVNHYLIVSGGAVGLAIAGVFFAPLSLASVLLSVYGCVPIYYDAYHSLVRERRLRACVLDAAILTSLLFTSYYLVLALGNLLYFVGVKLVLKVEDNSLKELTSLFGEQPLFVWRLVEGAEVKTPFRALQAGDIIVVNAGEMVPVDGYIMEGHGSLDQHKLTGESQPAEKGPGEQVFAATVLRSGRLHIEVEKTGSDTVAAQIGEILLRTTDYKAQIEARSQKLADQLVLPTFAIGAAATLTQGVVGGIAGISANFSDVLRVIAPLGMLNFLQLATEEGILIKDGRSLELLNQVDTVVFDKTGTLTLEQLQVGPIYCCGGLLEDELLTYAAAAEHRQTHPIAQAIQHEAIDRQLNLPPLDHADYEVGYGLRVKIGEHRVQVGSARFMMLEQITLPASVQAAKRAAEAEGDSLVYVAVDGRLAGAITLHPTLRPEAKQVVANLKERGLTLYIISGDHEQPTRNLAAELGITDYFAEVLPEDKANLVEKLQTQGKSVCFVGDGINDSIALKKANVSISIRGASTIAIDTAQVVLMDQTLSHLDLLFNLAEQFAHNQKGVLAATFVPSIICVGGVFLFHFGIYSSFLLYSASLAAGFSNAMYPRLKQQFLTYGKNPAR